MIISPTSLISVIIPVGERHGDGAELYRDYVNGLTQVGLPFELIFVLDGPRPEFGAQLQALSADGAHFTTVKLSRAFGESTALMAGFEHAQGDVVMTLPAYPQVVSEDLRKLIEGLKDSDFVTGRRSPRVGGAFERARRSMFHRLVATDKGKRFSDLGCSARAFSRRVLEEISLYGGQHYFLPVLADRQGFRVIEVDLRQSPKDRFEGRYGGSEYAHRALDIFTVFFLVRFTKKPLRFFGMIGASIFAIGFLLVLYLVIDRAFFGHALADRPALLLSSLSVVMGLQLFALGLLGELIIFTHARGIKEYQVDQVIQFPAAELQEPSAPYAPTGSDR